METKNYWEESGFLKNEANINEALQQLESNIGQMEGIFLKFTNEEILKRPAPGKWSKQEILGHLIDSAINNLKRFTEIQFLPQPYEVVSYRQDELVIVNHYQDLPLSHLLELWKLLNRQILFVVRNIPTEKLNYQVDPKYDNKEMKSLAWVIGDYVAHMDHHLKQLR